MHADPICVIQSIDELHAEELFKEEDSSGK
jgi:hypothetical protein